MLSLYCTCMGIMFVYIFGTICPGVPGVWGRGGVGEGRGTILGVNSFAVGFRVNSLALGLRLDLLESGVDKGTVPVEL